MKIGSNIVSIVRCSSYNEDEINWAISKLFEPFGGLANLIKVRTNKESLKILIKPNMLSAKKAESCVITHPAIIQAIAKKCKEINADVYIGDSPPLVNKNIDEFWEKTGYKAVAQSTNSNLVSFEKYSSTPIEIVYKSNKINVNITNYYFNSDVTINVAKLKTHNLTRLTCAVKNHYGLIPGLLKAQLHLKFPNAEDFGGFVTELVAKVPMSIHIIDAIDAMHGFGPAHGEPIKIGLLLASLDPFLVDMVISEIINCSPLSQPILNYAIDHSLAPRSISEINIVGCDDINKLKVSNFNVPNTLFIYKVPQSLYKILKKLIWAKPAKIESKCKKCKACEKVCSATAVYVDQHSGVRFDTSKCISCFCCVEVCPVAAIKIESSFILNILMKIKKLYKSIINWYKT